MKAVRSSAFSGSFYSSSSKKLSHQISLLFENCSNFCSTKNIQGLVVPHAGYYYSGAVAASGFNQIKKNNYERIVIIGPSHRLSFSGASIFDGSAYETPLGLLSLDEECISTLRSQSKLFQFIPQAHEHEHSIEVELPFIQTLFKNTIPIVPIVIGDKDRNSIRAIATMLHRICSDNTLFIASSDFSHFYTDEIARNMDYRAKDLILDNDLEKIFSEDSSKNIEMCGVSAILIVSMIMKKRGFKNIEAYQYANSGDKSEDKSSVVGYWSIGYS
jgi:MEMO1 family protein